MTGATPIKFQVSPPSIERNIPAAEPANTVRSSAKPGETASTTSLIARDNGGSTRWFVELRIW